MTEAVWDITAMAACAVAMRPDWDADQVTGSLVAFRTASWAPHKAMAEVCRVAGDEDGRPWDLLQLTRPVTQRVAGEPPSEEYVQAREDLAARESEPTQ